MTALVPMPLKSILASIVAASMAGLIIAQSPCDADLDHDGIVAGADLAIVLGDWGPCKGCQGDVTNNGTVDGIDLAFVLTLWGGECSQLPWATVLEFDPNPSTVFDPEVGARISATGLPWRVRDVGTGIEMVLIPPGLFSMGCSASSEHACQFREFPVHPVIITQSFYISRTEVTQAQWTAVMGANPSYFQSESPDVPAAEVPHRPVELVSWNILQGFLTVSGMRLPTEAEWEYACRASTNTAFHGWSATPQGTNSAATIGAIGWFEVNESTQTRPVGGKAANGFGLYDMAGNVWEWVGDWYGEAYYASSPANDPQGPASGEYRVLRGGSIGGDSGILRVSQRAFATPGTAASNYGFRVARNP
jgi:formylglycine-generating enzyme required for sulfatase activity